MNYEVLKQSQIPYISIFDSVKATHSIDIQPFHQYLKDTYTTNNTLSNTKHTALLFTQGVYVDAGNTCNRVRRDKNFIERWNGILVYDFDLKKEQKEAYKAGTDGQLIKDVNKAVDLLFNHFKEMELNVKTSSSNAGIHTFIVFDNNHLSDEKTKEIHEPLFNHFSKIFQNQVNNILIDNNLNHLIIKVDERFKSLAQMVALGKATKYYVDSKRVFNQTYLDGELKTIIRPVNITTHTVNTTYTGGNSTSYYVSGTNGFLNKTYTSTEINKLRSVFTDLIQNLNGFVSGYNNRVAVINALVLLGFNKSIIDPLRRFDKNNHNEYEGYYNTAKSNHDRNCLDNSYIQTAFFKLKPISDSKLGYDFTGSYVKDLTANTCGLNPLQTITTANTSGNVLVVNQYLDEVYSDIKAFVKGNKHTLLKAPTGSGKSYVAVKLLKELNKKNPNSYLVLACDTIPLAAQIAAKNGFNLLCGETNKNYTYPLKPGIYISTYDSIKKLDKIDFLIVDEAHQLINASDYRDTAINYLYEVMKNTRTLAITATPQYLYPLLDLFKILEVEVLTQIKNTYEIVDATGKDSYKGILNLILNNPLLTGNKAVVYINKKTDLDLIKDYLFRLKPSLNVVVIDKRTKENKNNKGLGGGNCGLDFGTNTNTITNHDLDLECYNSILGMESLIPDSVDILLTTCLLQNGINILNDNIQYVITAETEETSVIQFVARFRKGVKDKVYLIKTISDSLVMNLTFKDYNDYRKKVYAYGKLCEKFNKWQQTKSDINRQILKDRLIGIVLCENTNTWKVNTLQVANTIFEENRMLRQAKPFFFGTSGTNSLIQINSLCNSTLNKIEGIGKKKRDLVKEWYFKDDNFLKTYVAIRDKAKKDKSETDKKFYNDHKDKINSINITYLNDRYMALYKTFNEFNYYLSYEAYKELLKETKSVWVYSCSIIFNYILEWELKNKDNSKAIAETISITKTPKLNLLYDLKSKFQLNKDYTFDEIRAIYESVFTEPKFLGFKGFLGNSDNFILNCLECLYTVKKKRIEVDGKRVRLFEFKPFLLDNKYKDIYEKLDSKYNFQSKAFGLNIEWMFNL